jgi:chorismate mutase/prephenate dehydratase
LIDLALSDVPAITGIGNFGYGTNSTGESVNGTISDFSLAESAAPEPSTWAMIVASAGLLAFVARRRLAQLHRALPRARLCVHKYPMARTGYFGKEGSFSHLAATRRFPRAALAECPTVEEAFARLEAGEFAQIVVPIENGSSGIITNSADQLMRLAKTEAAEHLQVREALAMRVQLMLLARARTTEVRKIYSHRAPFDHSRAWLATHYPEAEQVIVESTSMAASLAAKEKGAAAIAGEQAVAQFGLKILSREVGAEVANQTTFIVVGEALPRPARATHTSLVFELPHRAGSLVAVLQVLSKRGLNLTKILSRPIPGRFEEYRFMIEFAGAAPAPAVADALARIRRITTFAAVIGSYPVRRV